MFNPFYRFITPLALVVVFCKITVHAQDLIVWQSLTGNSGSDLRGQAFIPSELGDGVGSTFSLDTLYLSEFNVYYAGGIEADKLYIYEALPASTSELDAGTGGTLIGESFNKELLGSKVSYKFGNLGLKTNTTYFAVFRQDVELWFGENADVAGPYAGGKMLYINGTSVVENDYTALQFSAYFYLTESVNQNDFNALIALYNATDGVNWTNKWDLNTDPREWAGVTWDENSRIVELNLNWNNLVGQITEEIADLSKLSRLNLSGNNLTGSIPPAFGNLTNLNYLSFEHNQLTGTIPSELGILTNLRILNLGSNYTLSGDIPAELGNLVNLEYLNVNLNSLSGSIPSEIGSLINLTHFYAISNNLTGPIPEEINNMAQLKLLDLYSNKLSQIPKFTLPSISSINIKNNNLTFESFETNIGLINNPDIVFDYYPQSKVMIETLIVKSIGDSNTFTVSTSGANNKYQWFKEHEPISEVTSNPEYVINSIEESNFGTYYCEITNTEVPGLILSTNDLVLTYLIKFENTGPEITQIQAASISFSSTVNNKGNIYYLALPSGAVAPSQEQILLGKDFNDATVNNAGNTSVTKGVSKSLKINNLEFNTAYDIYFVVQDEYKTTTDYATLTATTIEPIHFVENPEIKYVGANRVIFNINISRPCTVYAAVLREDTIPTSDEITRGYTTTALSIEEFDKVVEFEVTYFLEPSETHYVVIMAVDIEGYSTDIKKFEITTVAGIGFSDGYPEQSYLGADNVTFNVKVNREGMLYYVVIPYNELIYHDYNDQIKGGMNGDGSQMSIYDSLEIAANLVTEVDVSGLEFESEYMVIFLVEDIDGWYQISNVLIRTITSLAENEFTSSELSIYPNPSNDQLFVDFRQNEKYSLTITNLNGQEIYHKKDAKYMELVNVKSFNNGVYLINIITKDKSGWIRVVKE